MSKQQWGHGFYAGVASVEKKSDFPVGYFFLTFEDGFISHQGRVTGISGECYLVQYYSWIDGHSDGVIHLVNQLDTVQWYWFDKEVTWRNAGDIAVESYHRSLDTGKD